ncbi:MAG TPA: hypothetical protein VLX09_25865 [Stellaceae bacterium]|nr:hypothetical protein [Stellaceae bacterium]
MTAKNKPTAIMQWWLDKQTDLQRQLALARNSGNAREIRRLQNSIKRIDLMLKDMKR